MGTGRAFVAALADVATLADPDERRRTWRQGMAALSAAVVDRHDAPLEGLDPAALLAGVRVALSDGLLAEMTFLAPAAAATAVFALANGLPPGPERRELGRRVLEQLDLGDSDTFVALATAVALASRRSLLGTIRRARVAAALSAPLGAGSGADALAMSLLSSPELQRAWLDEPAIGSLPSRRLAARLLERAAREAVRRQRLGDDGGLAILSRAPVREVWSRLLADRESLVWRHAAIARGLVARADPARVAEIERELAPTASSSEWRRGAASLAAHVEVDPASAARCLAFLDGELPRRDAGVVRGLLAGLPGVFATEPPLADEIARRGVERAGLDAVEALAELRHDLGMVGPRAGDAAVAWLQRARAIGRAERPDREDDGRTALLAALAAELTGDDAAGGSLAAHAGAAREALRTGRLAEARRGAHAAIDAFAEAVDFLERYDDGDAVERRHAFRTLRELDHELLSDGTVFGLLARSDDVRAGRSSAVVVAELQARLEAALLTREREAATGAIPHPTLRLARLRALVRTIDADAPMDDAGAVRDRRLAVVRALLPRARRDSSPLRRAVWAALTRAFDALLRDEQLELSDLLCGWTTAMDPDEEFRIAREASMVPELRLALDAYAAAMPAAAAAADPDDRDAAIRAIAAAAGLPHALGAVSSPRTAALRTSLAMLLKGLESLARARAQRDVPSAALDQLQTSAAVLADLVIGARRRFGQQVTQPASPTALHALALDLERLRRGGAEVTLESDAAVAAVAATEDQVPLVARLIGVALGRLARLPTDAPARATTDRLEVPEPAEATPEAELPRWLPPSRTLGGFFVARPLGKGAGGSVFVACRHEERHDPSPELLALKVPDYDGGAARNLSLGEFEALFREEAGTLLALPPHPHLARFVTFDAGVRPKPILVMEYVPGPTLEQVLDLGGLDMPQALRLVDGIAAGLEAMHRARVAHLDLKPANVILRGEGAAAMPVLVDFGLAGRRLRPGCGSPHYGAPEVWDGGVGAHAEPYAADVYAFACLVYEIVTHEVLVDGDSLAEVLRMHVGGQARVRVRARLGRDHRTAPIAELLNAALDPRPEQRPSVSRVRAGLASIARDVARLAWPAAGR